MKREHERTDPRLKHLLNANPDNMHWIQRLCWLVIIWCEWKKREIRKRYEEEFDEHI